uniref:Protein kinase domain-containing protein n=1 Tax=Brassica campestris TaxID=3711 RepID=M4DGD3_BRACM
MSSSWIRGTCIRRGSFGTVSTAINKTDGEVFAVKSVDLATCLPAQLDSLENEISVRSLKPHPHIVRFLGDGVSKEGMTSFRNLHLEYLPEGDAAKNGIDETLLRRYAACLISALRHVHSRGLVHCDVKAKDEEVERSEWSAAMTRICKIATTRGANWETDGWVDVRSHHPSEEERAKIQYSEHNASLNPYDDVDDDSARSDVAVYPNRPPGNEDSGGGGAI